MRGLKLQRAENLVAEDWGTQTDREVIDSLLDVSGKFIVDAGCGDGELCRHLASRGARVLGIEPHPVQAEKNASAAVATNVGFAQAGAAAIPVESNSVDGLVFKNSLHHMHAPEFGKIFNEAARVLNSNGFLCIIEPVANGTFQYVMELFHDETEVRLAAYNAMVRYANPMFGSMREIYFDVDATYDSFDSYAQYFEGNVYNNYAADIRQPAVEQRFNTCENSHGSYTLTQPVRVNLYTHLRH